MVDLDLGVPIGIVPRTKISVAPRSNETTMAPVAPDVSELRTFERYELEDPNALRLRRLAALGKIQGVTKFG